MILKSCLLSMVSPVLCLLSEANRRTFVIQSEDTMNEVNLNSNETATAAPEEEANEHRVAATVS